MNLTILSIASVDLLLCSSAELEYRHLTSSGYSTILELHSGYSARARARTDNFGTLSVSSVKWCRHFLLRELACKCCALPLLQLCAIFGKQGSHEYMDVNLLILCVMAGNAGNLYTTLCTATLQ